MRYDALHLKVLSQLARMTRLGLVAELLKAETEDTIIETLTAFEEQCPRK